MAKYANTKKINLVYIEEVPLGVILKKIFVQSSTVLPKNDSVFVSHQIFPLFKRQINETTTCTHFIQSIKVNSFGEVTLANIRGGKTVHVVLKYLYRSQCWNFKTIYEGQKPSRNKVVVPARQAKQAGGIDSLESIPGLLKKIKNTVSNVERCGAERNNVSPPPLLPPILHLIREYFS